jgi:thiosulfate dehydrogenase [quinone] large subunit
MFINFLRENQIISYLFLVLRLIIGWKWITAGWKKVTGEFDATGFLNGAAEKALGERPAVQGWWADFLNDFAIPNVGLFNILVPWGELLVGVGLILGTFTSFASLMALVMNFAYLFSGTVSSNPNLIIAEVLILVGGSNAGKIGLDMWLIPYLKMHIQKIHGKSRRSMSV